MTKKAKTQPWQKVLLKAADYMEEHGHCKNVVEDRKGRVCIVGAIEKITLNSDVYCQAMDAISRRLGFQSGYQTIDWNNAPKRTGAEVVAVMREVATAPVQS